MISDELHLRISELKTNYPEIGEVLTDMEYSQNNFLSNVSHELKNSLSLIRSSLQFLESVQPKMLQNKYWADVKNDCGRMQALVQDLNDYSDGTRLRLQRTDIVLLIKDLYRSCHLIAEKSRKTLLFFNRSDSPFIHADPSRLREAFYNLIKNALEAIPEDGIVQIQISADARNIKIQITDDGCGIPADRLLTIFQPFVTYKESGIGLGLSVVKRIIEAHGGHISVSSAPELGSTFFVTLPKHPASDTRWQTP